MAAPKQARGAEKRKKKRKSRTQVDSSSSSSDSDSDAPQSSKKPSQAVAPSTQITQNEDVAMPDARDVSSSPSPSPAPAAVSAKAQPRTTEEFESMYLRKVTTELADDLDKVREAQDFKASSLPMLIHALRQGSSIYSPEEQRRVLNAAS